MKITVLWCALALMAACSTTSLSQSTTIQLSSSSSGFGSGFAAEMNTFRARQGFGPLQVNPALTRAAGAHAEDMAGRSYTQYGLGRSGNIWVQKLAASC